MPWFAKRGLPAECLGAACRTIPRSLPRARRFDLKLNTHRAAATFALVLALLTGALAAPAGAAPSANDVSRAQATVERRAREYEEASRKLRQIDMRLGRRSYELDKLLERQEALQRRLNARATGMYRGGRLGFLDVLTNSVTFLEFSSRLELLTRLNLRDARDLIELRATRTRVAKAADKLVADQESLSRELRRIEASQQAAARELSNSKAAYAEYVARVRAAQDGVSAFMTVPSLARSEMPSAPKSSKGWKNGVASHYGKGSFGRRTADGTRIGPDSMIVAHKTLPFGTKVQFAYRGRTVIARVADRGPYTPGRMWDLGPGVIRVLGFNGVDTVKYRVLGR